MTPAESDEMRLLPVEVLLPELPVLPWLAVLPRLFSDSPAVCFMSNAARLLGEEVTRICDFGRGFRVETARGDKESSFWELSEAGQSARGDFGVATAFGVFPE